MEDLELVLRRSRGMQVYLLGLGVVALGAWLACSGAPLSLRLCVLPGLGWYWWQVYRRYGLACTQASLVKLKVSWQRPWEAIVASGQCYRGLLDGMSFRCRWFVIVVLRAGRQRYYFLVAADSLSNLLFRRLSAYLG